MLTLSSQIKTMLMLEFDCDMPNEATLLETFGDSLDRVNFIADLESIFAIQITNEEVSQLKTVEDLIGVVAKHVSYTKPRDEATKV